jgi:endogenous inhibitor of DNA gyrase (YacG/DUF329 family)
MNAKDSAPSAGRRTQEGTKRVCPICGKPRSERHDPFCSRRCADVDLHRWLKGGYVIPGASASREPGDEEE